eukprot:CAMPEP_0174906780 /NCGR_PEP_ID=MMETSP0167-20121228/58334_1 /TAXON_ID=38298 /ORGANISM="Rhodella maculata, Strain CCMP736" /LENGTH=108 /DNA_ID=CAMNT_0016150093 /DNA_START=253 /DNA_END=580 /DNA_ORIENTATION=+
MNARCFLSAPSGGPLGVGEGAGSSDVGPRAGPWNAAGRYELPCRGPGRAISLEVLAGGAGFDVRDERVCAAAAPSGKGKGEAAILKDEGSGCFLGCLECEWLAESRHD